jgi:hypothetical protein
MTTLHVLSAVGRFCFVGSGCLFAVLDVDVGFIAGMVRARMVDGRQAMAVALAGVEVTTVADELDAPTSLAWSPDGAIYVADFGAGKVYRFAVP